MSVNEISRPVRRSTFFPTLALITDSRSSQEGRDRGDSTISNILDSTHEVRILVPVQLTTKRRTNRIHHTQDLLVRTIDRRRCCSGFIITQIMCPLFDESAPPLSTSIRNKLIEPRSKKRDARLLGTHFDLFERVHRCRSFVRSPYQDAFPCTHKWQYSVDAQRLGLSLIHRLKQKTCPGNLSPSTPSQRKKLKSLTLVAQTVQISTVRDASRHSSRLERNRQSRRWGPLIQSSAHVLVVRM